MNERDAIALLKALATDPAARGLMDDAALLGEWVITHDTIAEGVHFLADDPPASVGWKLAAVNASDLAAKGAEPAAALLSLPLGDEDWVRGFVTGLGEALGAFGMALIGGDTIALPDGSPRVLGLTALGRAGAVTPSRSGARAGDTLYLCGTIGDSAAGLALLKADPDSSGPLVEAYRRPRPLIAEGRALANHASAMMDVSDGLLLDVARIAEASGCAIRIDLEAVPLSAALAAARGDGLEARLAAASGGDDYALLLASPTPERELMDCLPRDRTIRAIGTIADGSGLSLAFCGRPVPLPERLGYEHRSA